MISAKVRWRWFPGLFEATLHQEIRKRMEKTIGVYLDEARRIVPVRTGNLKGSLTGEVAPGGLVGWYGSGRPWRGEPSVYYANYVEFGTSRMAPRPYLRPPLLTKAAEVRRIWQG